MKFPSLAQSKRALILLSVFAGSYVFFSTIFSASFSLLSSVGAQALDSEKTTQLRWDGNWGGNNFWCDAGSTLVSYHYDCGCSNNATWLACNVNAECSDAIDNDRDGQIDYPQELDCTGPADETEDSGLPDLTADTPSPDNFTAGSVTFSGNVENRSATEAVGSFGTILQIDLGNNGTIDQDISALPTIVNLEAFSPASVSAVTTLSAGTYSARFCADMPTSAIVESNETNNCGPAVTFTITEGTCSVTTDSNYNTGPCSGICRTGSANYPICSPTCSDGIDNDGDGVTDRDDAGCSSDSDMSEVNVAPTLTASPRVLRRGAAGTLTWNTNGTNEAECSLTGGQLGNSMTPILDDDSISTTEGTHEVRVQGTTTYTISCNGLSDTATFLVTPTGYES